MNFEIELYPRQMEAFNILQKPEITQVFFGGAAGGGKSYLGSMWLLYNSISYPGTRWLLGRSRLSTLKESTIVTLRDIINNFNLTGGVEFKLHDKRIEFYNGSVIVLRDLFYYPSNPDYGLGSVEYSGGFIDEGSEIRSDAYSKIMSRLRYKLDEYNITPKLLIASNPTRGFLYNEFYLPSINGSLKKTRKFIRSLPGDNPSLPESYINALRNDINEEDRQRYLYGNWEYVNNDFDIFSINELYESFMDGYTDDFKLNKKYYITADIADVGSDNTIICLWEDNVLINIYELSNSGTDIIVSKINEIKNRYQVDLKNIIVDANGVGVGVYNYLKCEKFLAQNKPFNDEPFINLKTQLFFKFSEKIKNKEIMFSNKLHKYKEDIITELYVHKRTHADNDGKFRMTSKDTVRREIGKSPDLADAITMFMYFYLRKKRIRTYVY